MKVIKDMSLSIINTINNKKSHQHKLILWVTNGAIRVTFFIFVEKSNKGDLCQCFVEENG